MYFLFLGLKIVSEHDQEIPQSQTADNPWHREEEPHNNHETPGSTDSSSTPYFMYASSKDSVLSLCILV